MKNKQNNSLQKYSKLNVRTWNKNYKKSNYKTFPRKNI